MAPTSSSSPALMSDRTTERWAAEGRQAGGRASRSGCSLAARRTPRAVSDIVGVVISAAPVRRLDHPDAATDANPCAGPNPRFALFRTEAKRKCCGVRTSIYLKHMTARLLLRKADVRCSLQEGNCTSRSAIQGGSAKNRNDETLAYESAGVMAMFNAQLNGWLR